MVRRALAAAVAAVALVLLADALDHPYEPSPPGSIPTATAPTPGPRP